jgi:archaellum biogenesis ATPase FlaH
MARKKFKEKERGIFQGHCACVLKECLSTDAGSFYLHQDGSYSYYCHSCHGSAVDFDPETAEIIDFSKRREINWEEEQEKLEYVRDDLIPVDNPDRRLRADVYEYYGCRMETASDGTKIEAIYYPSYRGGDHKGYRNRKRFQGWHKQVKKKPELLGVLKDFTGGIGDTQKGIDMFGQWLFPAGGKRIIINCGEEDALTVWKLTEMKTKFEGGYPSISCPSGENIAWVKPHIKYLGSFSEIYIIADQDKAGAKFEEDLCKILPVGKVRVVKLPRGYKDPSKMVQTIGMKKAADILWKAIWDAEKYSPAGIMSLSEGWGQYRQRGQDTLIRFPESFGDLNHKTHGGYALGEIVNIIAPSSVGKSSFVKEMIYSALESTNYKIGVISLEETIDEFIEGILSVHMSTQLNEISYDMRDWDTEEKAFKDLVSLKPTGIKEEDLELDEDDSERVQFLDHQGSVTGDELLEKIDFLVKGLDCKIIIVDPVTLAFCGHDTDEDDMASEIVKRVKRHKLGWINVHHVRKNGNGGTANSEGADLAEEDIKGTGAWFQTGMINLIFTRNKVHDNTIVRNTTKIKMSKCRRHGKNTGTAGYIYYNGDNGRLEQGISPEEVLSALDEDGESDKDVPLNSFGADEKGKVETW